MKFYKLRYLFFTSILFGSMIASSCGMQEKMAEAMTLQNAIAEEFELTVPNLSFNVGTESSLSVGISDQRVDQVPPSELKHIADQIHEFILEDSSSLAKADLIKIWFVAQDWIPEEDADYTFSFSQR